MSDLQNVLVTGATRGIGLTIAQRLLRGPYRIIGTGRELSEELGSLVESAPDRVEFVPYDLRKLEGIPKLVAGINRETGPLYALVNNAGVGFDGLLATQHRTEIEMLLRVNLEAPILLAKHCCRGMISRRRGRIINISSIVASTGFRGLAVYAATKSGLEGFSRSLARELGQARITVNCVAPGFIETEMTSGLSSDQLSAIRRRSPLGMPTSEDVAAAVEYLLSPSAAMVSGTTLTVDGASSA